MTNSGCHSVKWLSTAHPCAVCSSITMMSDIYFMWGFLPCVFRFIISRIQPKSEVCFFFHLASIYLTFGDKEELISILQKMDSSNVTFLWLKTVLEAGGFHLLDIHLSTTFKSLIKRIQNTSYYQTLIQHPFLTILEW